jgi:hypothetical protein
VFVRYNEMDGFFARLRRTQNDRERCCAGLGMTERVCAWK